MSKVTKQKFRSSGILSEKDFLAKKKGLQNEVLSLPLLLMRCIKPNYTYL